MKVILIKDVAKIGRRGAIVVVPDGFALNKLIPKGLAQTATPENIKRLEHVSATLALHKEADEASFGKIVEKLAESKIEITVEANAEGRMFQALKAEVIADAIAKITGAPFDVSHIALKDPIKTLGEHVVSLVSGTKQSATTITLIAKTK